MKELILARHAESELNAATILNGDPTRAVALTERGREQARSLGAAAGPVDLVAHTAFGRTKETAELAWPGTPTLILPELNEIAFGRFEGTRWTDGYDEWVRTAGPEEGSPGGGESRLAAVQRYLQGCRLLLDRPEDRVALVAHGAPVRYILLAVDDSPPTRVLESVELARPFVIEADKLVRAVEVIEGWAAAPVL